MVIGCQYIISARLSWYHLFYYDSTTQSYPALASLNFQEYIFRYFMMSSRSRPAWFDCDIFFLNYRARGEWTSQSIYYEYLSIWCKKKIHCSNAIYGAIRGKSDWTRDRWVRLHSESCYWGEILWWGRLLIGEHREITAAGRIRTSHNLLQG